MNLLISPLRLRRLGILGMNGRNIQFIARYNPRDRYPLVDNKLLTKQAAERARIAVPRLISWVDSPSQVSRLMRELEPLSDFVLKPAGGSGGRGIVVIERRDGEGFVKPSGVVWPALTLRRHISDTLSGLYTLGGKPDAVMLEERVQFDPVFADYSYEGVPDIRVVVFRGFPVMAMLRCSTHASDGRANLHQGAVGVGIDLRTGCGIRAVQRNRPVTVHPDTGHPFSALRIPDWRNLLVLAASCYEMTGLGYLGCDIVLDRRHGPLILELNARPGLAIQIANGAGLLPRLRAVERLASRELGWIAANRAEFAREQFGASA